MIPLTISTGHYPLLSAKRHTPLVFSSAAKRRRNGSGQDTANRRTFEQPNRRTAEVKTWIPNAALHHSAVRMFECSAVRCFWTQRRLEKRDWLRMSAAADLHSVPVPFFPTTHSFGGDPNLFNPVFA
jgi:hypothetical protein